MSDKGALLLKYLLTYLPEGNNIDMEHFMLNPEEYDRDELHDLLCDLYEMSDSDFEKVIAGEKT